MTTKKTVRDVMTQQPLTMDATAMIAEAASTMRDRGVGDVLVMKDGALCGIVTDRDIVVRAIAAGKDTRSMPLGDICSKNVFSIEPDEPVGAAVKMMSDKAIRRLPVVENGKPIGMLSLGDLAMERDPKSALADISAAPPNI